MPWVKNAIFMVNGCIGYWTVADFDDGTKTVLGVSTIDQTVQIFFYSQVNRVAGHV